MLENKFDKIGALVLAAGKGTRLGCTDKPKVMLEIGDKPIVSYIVETLFDVGFTKEQIILVVGFEKQVVKDFFGDSISYADQDEQLGTAHAAYIGMNNFSENIETVLVIGGDDSAFYSKDTLENFIKEHLKNEATISLLTVEPDNFESMGRVIRDDEGNFVQVLEKEQLDDNQKKIKETSTGTYCFDRSWFEDIFPSMGSIEGLGEYGLPSTVEIAIGQGKKVQAIKLQNNKEWFGINTPEELEQANLLLS